MQWLARAMPMGPDGSIGFGVAEHGPVPGQRAEPQIGQRSSCNPLVWARFLSAFGDPQVLRKMHLHIYRCMYAYVNRAG